MARERAVVAAERVVPVEAALVSKDEVLRLQACALRATVAVVPATAAAFVPLTRQGAAAGAVSLGDHSVPGASLTMQLRSAETVVAAIVLTRAGEGFTGDDAAVLRRIQPLIEQAYCGAVEPRRESARAALRRHGLTARQADVALLAGRGDTNAEIARSLHVSEATVKTHLARAFAKAGVRSRTRLAVLLGGGVDG
jgi:DNA-binding NarL/FixJ family response regulator